MPLEQAPEQLARARSFVGTERLAQPLGRLGVSIGERRLGAEPNRYRPRRRPIVLHDRPVDGCPQRRCCTVAGHTD
jgi:hypothetical protein